MSKLFPANAGITELRGTIKIIKEHGGAINISGLAESAREQIDYLLPLIDACEMLGFAHVDRGIITLTNKSMQIDVSSFLRETRNRLARVEPFKSFMSVLKQRLASTTPEIAAQLTEKGIQLHEDPVTNEETLKNLMLRWGVRTKLFSYNARSDEWRVTKRS